MISFEVSEMGNTVDTERMGRLIKGIDRGESINRLMEISGYGRQHIKSVMKNPDKYRRLLNNEEKREEEKRQPTKDELFYKEWLDAVNHIRIYAGKKPLS